MPYPGVLVNTTEIDKRRSYYRDVVQQWSNNLYELDEPPTYRLLAAGEMSGQTGEQTTAVMENAPQLWAWLGTLRDHLDGIDEILDGRSMFNNPNEDAALLLSGRSIQLHATSIPNTLPSAVQRRFEPMPADPETMLISCDGLIELFRAVYEPVRDVVARLDATWRDLLPRIDAASVTLDRAKALSERLSVRLPEVQLASQRLEAVKATVADDPLSLSSRVGPDLDALAAAAAAAAGALERSHGSLDVDLQGTDSVLADLRVLRARAAAAYSEAEAKVIPHGSLIRVPGTSIIDGPNGLAHRATQIVGDATAGSRDWRSARRELDGWHHSAGRLREQLTRALDSNTEPIEERNELRGRLRAYRVKADMTSGLPEEIGQLGQLAHDELYTSPTDLKRAKDLIENFASQLANYAESV